VGTSVAHALGSVDGEGEGFEEGKCFVGGIEEGKRYVVGIEVGSPSVGPTEGFCVVREGCKVVDESTGACEFGCGVGSAAFIGVIDVWGGDKVGETNGVCVFTDGVASRCASSVGAIENDAFAWEGKGQGKSVGDLGGTTGAKDLGA